MEIKNGISKNTLLVLANTILDKGNDNVKDKYSFKYNIWNSYATYSEFDSDRKRVSTSFIYHLKISINNMLGSPTEIYLTDPKFQIDSNNTKIFSIELNLENEPQIKIWRTISDVDKIEEIDHTINYTYFGFNKKLIIKEKKFIKFPKTYISYDNIVFALSEEESDKIFEKLLNVKALADKKIAEEIVLKDKAVSEARIANLNISLKNLNIILLN